MNTFEISKKTDFQALLPFEKAQVVAELKAAHKNNELITIQAETFCCEDYEEVRLYGVYAKTADGLSNYDSNGGLWRYFAPQDLLNEFGVGL